MLYYPKSKIIENQYTSGGQFIYSSTGKSYEGLYHITYDQNYYTGATHTNDSQLLIKQGSSTTQTGSYLISAPYVSNFEYDTITDNRFSFLKQEIIPQPYYPVLTDQDYSTGYFVRYFMKRSGGSARYIKEISGDDFTDITTNVLYLSTSFQWKLTGPAHDQVIDYNNTIYGVIDTNARTVASNESILPGITQYLSNLQEFARIV